jgi:hypothetical protein
VSGCERVNLFFASQLVPFISRPYRRQIVLRRRRSPMRSASAFKTCVLCHPPFLRKPRSEILEKFQYARNAPNARQLKVFQPLTRLGDSRLRRSGKCDRDARAHWPVQRVVKITFFIGPGRFKAKRNEVILFGLPQIRLLSQMLCLVRRGRVAGRPAANRR